MVDNIKGCSGDHPPEAAPDRCWRGGDPHRAKYRGGGRLRAMALHGDGGWQPRIPRSLSLPFEASLRDAARCDEARCRSGCGPAGRHDGRWGCSPPAPQPMRGRPARPLRKRPIGTSQNREAVDIYQAVLAGKPEDAERREREEKLGLRPATCPAASQVLRPRNCVLAASRHVPSFRVCRMHGWKPVSVVECFETGEASC
jgi:hypothetical protein